MTTANGAGNHPDLDNLLADARAQFGRGAIAEAATLYQRVLAIAPDHGEALVFVGQRALADGHFELAKSMLERAVGQNGRDVQLLNTYGLSCIGAGRLDEARVTFERLLVLAPDFFVARLHLGHVLENLGNAHAALREYFVAILHAQAKGRWMNAETTAPALHGLVTAAMRFVNGGRRQLLGKTIASLRVPKGDAALQRVQQALDIYLQEVPPNYVNRLQKPKFLYAPGLPTTPFFARELFAWYAELERNTAIIREELTAVLGGEEGIEPFLKLPSPDVVPQYLGGGPQGAPAWDAFFFYRHGTRYDENCARCPRTTAIIETLPLARIRAHAPEICFSVLAPGTHILPHHGVTNARVVTHLPLIVPEDCALRVGGEEHAWQEGRCITFDDTFEHEAWNRSAQTRVVLILDSWNPYLSAVECAALTGTIEAIGDFNRECGISEPS
jgi:aspartate beta-hydroxylase